jgi:hypothetical protein
VPSTSAYLNWYGARGAQCTLTFEAAAASSSSSKAGWGGAAGVTPQLEVWAPGATSPTVLGLTAVGTAANSAALENYELSSSSFTPRSFQLPAASSWYTAGYSYSFLFTPKVPAYTSAWGSPTGWTLGDCNPGAAPLLPGSFRLAGAGRLGSTQEL